MRKVLILGAGNAQIDAIDYCRNAGYEVVGCSYTTVEKGIGHLDVFENVDIKDMPAVRELVERHNVDLIYSVGSDIAMPTIMSVSEALGLPHFISPETANICLRKNLLRSKLGGTTRKEMCRIVCTLLSKRHYAMTTSPQ